MFPVSNRRRKVCTPTTIMRGRTWCVSHKTLVCGRSQGGRERLQRLERSIHRSPATSMYFREQHFAIITKAGTRMEEKMAALIFQVASWGACLSCIWPSAVLYELTGACAQLWKQPEAKLGHRGERVVEQCQLPSKTLWTAGPWETLSHKVLLDVMCGATQSSRFNCCWCETQGKCPRSCWCQHAQHQTPTSCCLTIALVVLLHPISKRVCLFFFPQQTSFIFQQKRDMCLSLAKVH